MTDPTPPAKPVPLPPSSQPPTKLERGSSFRCVSCFICFLIVLVVLYLLDLQDNKLQLLQLLLLLLLRYSCFLMLFLFLQPPPKPNGITRSQSNSNNTASPQSRPPVPANHPKPTPPAKPTGAKEEDWFDENAFIADPENDEASQSHTTNSSSTASPTPEHVVVVVLFSDFNKANEVAARIAPMKTIPIQRPPPGSQAATSTNNDEEKPKGFLAKLVLFLINLTLILQMKGRKPSLPVVGTPYNVQHHIHVDFNSRTGFVGLPPEWEALILGGAVDLYPLIPLSLIDQKGRSVRPS